MKNRQGTNTPTTFRKAVSIWQRIQLEIEPIDELSVKIWCFENTMIEDLRGNSSVFGKTAILDRKSLMSGWSPNEIIREMTGWHIFHWSFEELLFFLTKKSLCCSVSLSPQRLRNWAMRSCRRKVKFVWQDREAREYEPVHGRRGYMCA